MSELLSIVNKSGNKFLYLYNKIRLYIFIYAIICLLYYYLIIHIFITYDSNENGRTYWYFLYLFLCLFSETCRSSIDDGFLTKRDPTELRINFEQFCALATESSWRMKSNGVSCESEIPSVWSILCRKATKFLRRAIVQPFNRFLGISYSQKFPTTCSSVCIVSVYELANRLLKTFVPRLIVHESVRAVECTIRSTVQLFRLDQFLRARIREERLVHWSNR